MKQLINCDKSTCDDCYWHDADTGKGAALALAREGEIAYIEHRYHGRQILKVICSDREKLLAWGREHGIPERWLHVSRSGLPHFDLWGSVARKVKRSDLNDRDNQA